MAQQRWGPGEAFGLLRRASQRKNVKVSVLAGQIVEQLASPTTGDSACLQPATDGTVNGRSPRAQPG